MVRLRAFCIIVLALALSSGCASHAGHCKAPALAAPVEGITVLGHGKASGQPDVARINLGIEVRAATAQQATLDLNTRMATLIASVKQAGVPAKDIRTSNFSINFEQVPEQAPEPPPAVMLKAPAEKAVKRGNANVLPAPPSEPSVKLPAGYYRASNTVELTLRDLSRAAEVLTIATRAGANQVFGIEFQIENTTALEMQASARAFADARMRAAKLAEQSGMKLGRVVSITEVGEGAPLQKSYGMARADAVAMPSVSVERGELTVQATVQVVFELPHAE